MVTTLTRHTDASTLVILGGEITPAAFGALWSSLFATTGCWEFDERVSSMAARRAAAAPTLDDDLLWLISFDAAADLEVRRIQATWRWRLLADAGVAIPPAIQAAAADYWVADGAPLLEAPDEQVRLWGQPRDAGTTVGEGRYERAPLVVARQALGFGAGELLDLTRRRYLANGREQFIRHLTITAAPAPAARNQP